VVSFNPSLSLGLGPQIKTSFGGLLISLGVKAHIIFVKPSTPQKEMRIYVCVVCV